MANEAPPNEISWWWQTASDAYGPSTTILGFNFSAPFYITPCARAVGGHEKGEINLVKGAAAGDILYIPSGYSSYTFKEIQAAKAKGQVVFQQVRRPAVSTRVCGGLKGPVPVLTAT